ncbi:hypothetical protein [Streptomyces sp. RFCAC02]|uniref:hypothetical protein n=1 Tax=Streptomyces sp. RFCAC02 TaxID=2499143 RepID=UPI0010224CA2|nr:hypothetical protein [Streptomyces sp. RFCAC02]
MTRWDVYGDPALDDQLAKNTGPAWDALRGLIAALGWQADQVGWELAYPWPNTIRRALIQDDTTVYGVAEYILESRRHRIARILAIAWLPDIPR